MTLTTTDLTPRIATEIRGRQEDSCSAVSTPPKIRELLELRGVLVFPKVNFSDEEQVAFTRRWARSRRRCEVTKFIKSRSIPRSTTRRTTSRLCCIGHRRHDERHAHSRVVAVDASVAVERRR